MQYTGCGFIDASYAIYLETLLLTIVNICTQRRDYTEEPINKTGIYTIFKCEGYRQKIMHLSCCMAADAI